MSAVDKTGGPAFPTLEEHGFNSGMPGMTLRDYFAAHASDSDIEALLLRIPAVERVVDVIPSRKEIRRGPPVNARQIARYMHADAMLAARQGGAA